MKGTSLEKYNNDWYKKEIGASVLKRSLWYITSFLFVAGRGVPSSGIKVFLLRLFGARIGEGVVIKPGVNIKYPWKLQIANNSWIGENVWIDNLANVSIGSNVCISQGAMLLTGNHDYSKETFDLKVSPITIEDGAWIGARATVCPGLIVFSHAMLAVQSVATSNLEPWSVYQGNPAIRVKERTFQ